jgi:hypothetical protein
LALRRTQRTLPSSAWWSDASTGAGGRFLVEGLPDRPGHVAASRWPVDREVVEVLALVPDVAVDGEPLDLVIPDPAPLIPAASGSVTVLLRDATRPVLDASVSVSGEAGRLGSGRLVAPGRVRFEDVPYGRWTISGTVPGCAPFEVDDVVLDESRPDREVTVDLRAGSAVVGRVRNFASLGSRRAELRLRGADGVAIDGMIDRDGSFIVRSIKPGALYRLELELSDSRAQEQHWMGVLPSPLVVSEGTADLGDVEFVRGGRLRVGFLNRASPMERGRLRLDSGSSRVRIELDPFTFPIELVVPIGPIEASFTCADGEYVAEAMVNERGAARALLAKRG